MALQSLLLWSLSVSFMSHFRNAVLYLQFYMTGSFIVFLVIVYFLVILFLGKQGCDASCDFHCITKLSHALDQLPVSTTAELVIICIFIGNQKHNTVIMLDTFTIAHKSVKICTSKKLGNQKLQLSFLFFFKFINFQHAAETKLQHFYMWYILSDGLLWVCAQWCGYFNHLLGHWCCTQT